MNIFDDSWTEFGNTCRILSAKNLVGLGRDGCAPTHKHSEFGYRASSPLECNKSSCDAQFPQRKVLELAGV